MLYKQITGLTYGGVTEEVRQQTRNSWRGIDVVYSAGLLLGILVAYLYFQG